jgi:phage head maturation protease
MAEDEHGLRYEIDLPDKALGRNVTDLLHRGDSSGSSLGFRTIGDEWPETKDGYPLRTLTEVTVSDEDPMAFPAHSSTDASLRSLAEERSLDLDTLIRASEDNCLRYGAPGSDSHGSPSLSPSRRPTSP